MFPGLNFFFPIKLPDDDENIAIDPVSIVWFHFLECQLNVCCNSIKTESYTISSGEVAEELDILANKIKRIKSRRNENFRTSKLI
jgi:hypothetical protein